MPFRINAINFSLTYPQANTIDKQGLFDFLKTLNPVYLIVAQETHTDGGKHFHVFFKCERKRDIRRSDYFDFGGHHPNIQGTRDPKNWVEYLKKEDLQPIEFGKLSDKRTWAQLLSVGTEKDFMSEIQALSPRDFVLQNERITTFAKRRFSKPEIYQPRYTAFNPTANMVRWTNQRFEPERPRSLFIKGPSRYGKTEWARSLGIHMYFNGMINLDDWNPAAEYIIFDDFDWTYLPCKKAFLGAQKQFTITDKYKKKKTVFWGKPCILLYNEDMDPLAKCSTEEVSWLTENVIFTEITNKLF